MEEVVEAWQPTAESRPAEKALIFHVLLFRPRAGLPDSERQAVATAFERAVREIPSVRRASVGRRVTHGAGYEALNRDDYPCAVVIEFDDLAGLQAYLQHPAHAEPAERFFAAIEASMILDYEIEGIGPQGPGPRAVLA